MITYYRVVSATDITTYEAVGDEMKRIHRTEQSALDAIEDMTWDPDWGTEPEVGVAAVDYPSDAAAEEDGMEIVG